MNMTFVHLRCPACLPTSQTMITPGWAPNTLSARASCSRAFCSCSRYFRAAPRAPSEIRNAQSRAAMPNAAAPATSRTRGWVMFISMVVWSRGARITCRGASYRGMASVNQMAGRRVNGRLNR